MVIGALAGLGSAGVGLVSAMMQSRAQADQRNLAYLNLYETRRANRERERLAKADRTDAYGNRVTYTPGIGFETEVTPIIEALLNAQTKEQLAGFRDDAPRARQAAIRRDERAQEAGDVYDELFNDYRYRRRKSENEYIAEAIRESIDARRGRRRRNGTGSLARQALRTGTSSAIPGMLREARQLEGEEQTLAEAIAGAKQTGRNRFVSEEGARNNQMFGELNQLRAIADAVTPANLNYDNEADALAARSDNALSQLINASVQGSNMLSNAYAQAGRAAGQSPDLSSIVAGLGQFGRAFTTRSGRRRRYEDDDMFKGNTGDF